MQPDITFKALAVPVRRQLFEFVCLRPRSVSELARLVPVSRPAVSQHLSVLGDAKLVRMTPVGTRNVYSVWPGAADELRSWLDEMWTTAFGAFGELADPRRETERMRMEETSTIPPVVKILELNVAPAHAFEVFTKRMNSWWPVLTHSVSTEEVEDVVFGNHVGDVIREIARDGTEHVWGTITAYTRGERISFTWHPGAAAEHATHVDVRFDAADSRTRVTLLHTGWEIRGADGQHIRDNYESGWDLVLAPYVAAAVV